MMESAAAVQKRCAASDARQIAETLELAVHEAQQAGIIAADGRLYNYINAEEVGALVESADDPELQLQLPVDTAVMTVTADDTVTIQVTTCGPGQEERR